jgi:small-conductance mechanosensitive channel
MEILTELLRSVSRYVPTVVTLGIALIVLYAAQTFMEKRLSRVPEGRFRLQLAMLGFSTVALVVVVLALPISEASRGQLLSLLGIVLSAAVALSSTTLLGNIMAGATLRAVRAFRTGDFIRVERHFGRVTERGLFHVEIQTEDRDLTTLPNLFLVTKPVAVVRSTGTIVSTTLSLGYDVPRDEIEKRLLEAAGAAELEEPFVQILELGDFSVTYRIAGLYKDVKQILSKRSELRGKVLDSLHGAGIEIVSPNFMNTRAVAPEQRFISSPKREENSTKEKKPEAIVFDKAEQAEFLENLREQHQRMGEDLAELKTRLGEAKDEEEKKRLEAAMERLERQREQFGRFIETEIKAEEN